MALAGFVAAAAAGWPLTVTVLVYVAIAGGVQAFLWAAIARARGLERPRTIPYALAIAAGTIPAFISRIALF
jgi:Flp pilus assembly protein protease CpaA